MAQPIFHCFAVTPPGVEELCSAEIRTLGLAAKEVPGGVEFDAVARDLYRVNLWSRVASRVLVRLGEFQCRDFPELYRQALRLPWGRFVKPDRVCKVRVSSRNSRLNHSGRIAETVLDAVRKANGSVPQVLEPEQLIFVRIEQDRCQLSIDSSGDLLHRRGYRQAVVAAPLRENLAAAILLKLGYSGKRPLLDVMTGSGSFAIEAALIAAGLAPGRMREFAFMGWPHFRPNAWKLCLQEKGSNQEFSPSIRARDMNPDALDAARENARMVGVEEQVSFELGRMEDLQLEAGCGLLVCNPPYGERLGEVAPLRKVYREFGRICRDVYPSWDVGWISADRRFEKEANLGCRRHWSFSNGGIGVELRLRTANRAGEKA